MAQPGAPLMRFTSADGPLCWIVFKYIFSNYFLKCLFLMQMKHQAGKSKIWFVGVGTKESWEANQSLNYLHRLLCGIEKAAVRKYRGIKVLLEEAHPLNTAHVFRPLMTTSKYRNQHSTTTHNREVCCTVCIISSPPCNSKDHKQDCAKGC